MKKTVFILSIFILISLAYSAQPVSLPRTPAVSNNGEYIVFSYNGDLWKVAISGGNAIRLTDNIGIEINPVFSPCGKYIAFSSDRNGNFDVYIMSVDGGMPKQLTFRDSPDYVNDWTPDGKYIIYHTNGELHHFYRNININKISVSGGTPSSFIPELSKYGKISHSGNLIIFNRGTAPELRKRYRGSANIDIFSYNIKNKIFKQLTNFNGNDKWPLFSKDDKFVYFVSDRDKNSVFNLYKLDLSNGKIFQLTFFKNGMVRFPSIAKNKNLIVFEYKNSLYKIMDGGKPEKINIYAPADYKDPAIVKKTYSSKAETMRLSPKGDEIAFIIRGKVFVLNEKYKRVNRITDDSFRTKDICWSKDGKTLYFNSDKTGNYDIYKVYSTDNSRKNLSESLKLRFEKITSNPKDEFGMKISPDGKKLSFVRDKGDLVIKDIKTGKENTIVKGWSELDYSWSPDSKWIAYSQNDNDFNTDIYIISSSGGKPHNITKFPDEDTNPVFSKDGDKLFFISKRGEYASRQDVNNNINVYMVFLQKKYDEMNEYELKKEEERELNKRQKPKNNFPAVKIDFENIHNRIRPITTLMGTEYGISVSPNGKTVAFISRNSKGANLYSVRWDGKKLKQLTKSGKIGGDIVWSKKGKTIYFRTSMGTFGKISNSGSGYKSIPFRAKIIINKPLENLQKYNEGWRTLFNYFYDKNFHGTNWIKDRDYYKPWAIKTRTTNDFNYVFTMLLGELNSSHQGIRSFGGKNQVNTGYLGVKFCPHYKGDGVKIHKILKYGPADREITKLHKEDIIIAVNNHKVSKNTNIYKLFEDTAGKETLLTIKREKDKKEIIIRPVNYYALKTIIYKNMVVERRALVEKLTNGRLTYIHIRSMGTPNAREFEKELYSVAHGKDGLIIDVRNNGGGWITDMLLTMLMTRQHAITIPRDGGKGYPQGRRVLFNWPKPIVVLINENSYSNAEIFPWSIRTLKRGKLIGEQTFGAVISTGAVFLIDDTYVRMPFRGWYVNNGKFINMEHNGCPPDIRIPYKLGNLIKGKDNQLLKAIEVLKQEVKNAKKLRTWPDWIDIQR
jgi:Tol biopolymer transport system component/C-terminal processing protease CtpA/Prc